MNDFVNAKGRRMKLSEVAEALGLSRDKAYRSAGEPFPNILPAGKTAYLNKAQVTALKYSLRKTAEVMAATKTSPEKALLIKQAMQLQQEIIESLQAENSELKSQNKALSRDLSASRRLLDEREIGMETYQSYVEANGLAKSDRNDILATHGRRREGGMAG